MTERLEQAIAQVNQLPAEAQDAIAALILDELKDEQRWDHPLADSQPQRTKLAALVVPCGSISSET